MGRSTESFNKKEKEKKRLKKQQDKREKAEERKANSNKGKGLEDMLAYIDENGNISSTPPDPAKKKSFSTEEISIGVPRQQAEEVDPVRKGTITYFNESKGYGFIKDSQTSDSVFFHIKELTEPVQESDRVTFETEKGPKGLVAKDVKKAAR